MDAQQWAALPETERKQLLARVGQSVADDPRNQILLPWTKLPYRLQKALRRY